MSTAGVTRRVPIREGLFTIPEDPREPPRLLGSECPACGARFASKRAICLGCAHRGLRPCELSPRGVIHTFTIVRQTPKGAVMEAPYAIGAVKLEDGPVVQTVFVQAPLEAVRVGLPVEMTLHEVRRDDEGAQVVAYAFRPRKEAA